MGEQIMDLITESEIKKFMKSSRMGRKVVYFEETDSTNIQAKLIKKGSDWDGTLVIAEKQNLGKGRRGRSWSSPAGSGIWMSLLIKPDIPTDRVSSVTLVSALAVHRALRKLCPSGLLIKWPNDLVINGKKLCGILTEMSCESSINYVVIGIGINVNNSSFPEEIGETATSLSGSLGHAVKRAPIVADFLSEFENLYEDFEKKGDISFMLDEYERFLANKDRRVRVLKPENEWEGTARGVNKRGELLVENDRGEIITVISGEVSVRGLYGYS